MRTPIDDFQIYLLSKMSDTQRVDASLQHLGVTRTEMAQLAASSKLEPPVLASAYIAILGPPANLTPSKAGAPFAGSKRQTWVLPIWPAVDFVVNEHPEGWAWGERFEQRDENIPSDLDRVQPWEWCENLLVPAAQHQELVDRWTDFLDVKLTFGSTVFAARFDFGLLQTWQRV